MSLSIARAQEIMVVVNITSYTCFQSCSISSHVLLLAFTVLVVPGHFGHFGHSGMHSASEHSASGPAYDTHHHLAINFRIDGIMSNVIRGLAR